MVIVVSNWLKFVPLFNDIINQFIIIARFDDILMIT